MDNDVARISEIPRPPDLLPPSACQNFGDMVISCYFATHKFVESVSVSELEIICSKFGAQLDDVIGEVA